MAAVMEQERAIFTSAGQAVHVAFLVMAQEATQDAPFRMALIRIMEAVKLDSGNQRHWLDQLRGDRSGTVNFGGLSSGDIRAQCALITQAVTTNLPAVERWVLQAKYGQTDFEDVIVDDDGYEVAVALPLRQAVEAARLEEAAARDAHQEAGKAFRRLPDLAARRRLIETRAAFEGAMEKRDAAERKERVEQVSHAQVKSSGGLMDNGRPSAAIGTRRRWAFSAERIEAIKGLSDWFAPMFPRIKPLALDCMLGRIFANHKKIDISARDLAAQFGGNHTRYIRATWKMKNHLRILEEKAIERLEPIFIEHGVSCGE